MGEKMRAFWQSDVVRAWGGAPAPVATPVLQDESLAAPEAGPPTSGIDFPADEGLQSAAPELNGTPGGPGAPGGPGNDKKALESTATDIFFDWDSAELTASAQNSLKNYAKAYVAAKSTETIVIKAYASTEGDEGYNQDLSDRRAKAVAEYLKQQKDMPQDKVKEEGKGETANFGKDLAQNRRATLSPPPPTPPQTPPTKPTKPQLGMRDPTPQGGKKKPDMTVRDPSPPKPPPKPKVVTVAEIEQELIDFLKKLAEHQKSKDGKVTSTDKVWLADNALNQGNGGPRGPTKRGGEGGRYDPKKLAGDIVRDLKDPVPDINVKRFRELEPTDTPVDLTFEDHLHNKWKVIQGKVHKVIDAIPLLPNKAKDFLKEKFDKAVKDGAEWILDKAMEEVKIPEDAKKKLKELYKERVEKVMDGKKKKKEEE